TCFSTFRIFPTMGASTVVAKAYLLLRRRNSVRPNRVLPFSKVSPRLSMLKNGVDGDIVTFERRFSAQIVVINEFDASAAYLGDLGSRLNIMTQRAVITGLGIVSPIGIGVAEFWKAALDGRCGISAIRSFDPFTIDDYRSRIAGQVENFFPEELLDPPH